MSTHHSFAPPIPPGLLWGQQTLARRLQMERLPDFVEAMKAKLLGSMPVGAWIYEIKFDGYRALALRVGGETRILSRNEKDLGGKFPAVRDSIAALDISTRSPLADDEWSQ